jgi:hypothetical protein
MAGLVALPLTAAGSTINPGAAAQAVVDIVSQQTTFHPTDVTCPSGVEAKIGVRFECNFTGPDGLYTADMRVRNVDGDQVEFYIKTHPS